MGPACAPMNTTRVILESSPVEYILKEGEAEIETAPSVPMQVYVTNRRNYGVVYDIDPTLATV